MRSCCPMRKEILIVNGGDLRRIDIDIGKETVTKSVSS